MTNPLSDMVRRSLGARVVLIVILGEVAFALVLGVTIGMFSMRSVAQERRSSMRQASELIAASIMPIVADQQEPQVRAQMRSILDTVGVRDIQCIRIVDSAGGEIAVSDDTCECGTGPIEQDASPIALITQPQIIEQPVEVGELEVARVYVRFAPTGLMRALEQPGLASAIIVLSVVLVSAPWTAWLFMRSVVDPLGDVGDAATRIADGDLEVHWEKERLDEIGMLQDTLARMANQLKDRDARLQRSFADLSEAYRSLEQAKDEIETLATIKSDFVAVASHELRTPLAAIRLYAEMMESGEICELDESGLDAAAAIGAASNRLTSIVSDLMDSALLERGMLPLQIGDVWVDELLQKTVADANVLASAHDMTVMLGELPPDCIVRGDPTRLRQVLDNLLSNAIKYSDPGSSVRVDVRASDEWVEIDVADQGRGIATEDRSKLFTLFGRLDVKDSRDTAGLGLGLAISARIVEAHGGAVTFSENPQGKGSVFTVKLPAERDEVLKNRLIQIVGHEGGVRGDSEPTG